MSPLYWNNYILILIFFGLGIMLPIVALNIARLLRPSNPYSVKRETYESGNEPIGESWVRFKVKYYIFALLFVVFEVETVFLYPWAVIFDNLDKWFAFLEMTIFLVILVIGLIYAWRKKVLEWK